MATSLGLDASKWAAPAYKRGPSEGVVPAPSRLFGGLKDAEPEADVLGSLSSEYDSSPNYHPSYMESNSSTCASDTEGIIMKDQPRFLSVTDLEKHLLSGNNSNDEGSSFDRSYRSPAHGNHSGKATCRETESPEKRKTNKMPQPMGKVSEQKPPRGGGAGYNNYYNDNARADKNLGGKHVSSGLGGGGPPRGTPKILTRGAAAPPSDPSPAPVQHPSASPANPKKTSPATRQDLAAEAAIPKSVGGISQMIRARTAQS
eukprot:TRINITY_DN63030_c0_g1_i1.p1 TRINITY_DN63030_c0_g1~~TRINITY_DN63030_c0_g1_i1.p1  ORF type:complete len:284 (-),score=58.16 TRINITY_DN63030_c0_g1_i1:385-1161(-)